MLRFGSRRRVGATLAVAAIIVAAVSCQDRELVSAPDAPIESDAVDFASPDFDVFDADVVIRQERAPDGKLRPAPDPIAYHVQRRLQPNGIWASTMTFTDAQGVKSSRPSRVANVAGVNISSREWIGNYVVTPQSGGRARTAFEARAGKPQAGLAGTDRYAWTQDATEYHVVMDQASGAVLQETVRAAGRTLAHTIHAYSEVSPGVFIKRSSRVETTLPSGTQVAFVTELRNIRLAKQRGAL